MDKRSNNRIKSVANTVYNLLLVQAYLRISIAIGTRGFSICDLFAKLVAETRN